MTTATISVLFLLVVVSTSVSAAATTTTPPPTTTPLGCLYEGQWYPEGNINHDLCQPCYCQNGQAICMISDCRMPACIDPVVVPGQCCPICPNGSNCQAPDGSIIPGDGELHRIDEHTSCYCKADQGIGFLPHTESICFKTTATTALPGTHPHQFSP